MSEPWYEQALFAARNGRLAPALTLIDRQLAVAPGDAASLALKAALLNELGRPREAVVVFEQAVAADPGNAVVHSNHGNALARLGRPGDAVRAYDRALAIDPDYVAALCNRAGQRLDLRQGEAALDDARRAVALQPQAPTPHRQESLVLATLGRLDQALAAIDRALALDDLNPDSHQRRGTILAALGRQPEAAQSFNRAIALDPGAAEGLFGRGLERLRRGEFAAGWVDIEHRWRSGRWRADSTDYAGNSIHRHLDFSADAAAVAGQSILVIDEQALGDQVMFASILPDLAAVAGQVTCVCNPRLLTLFRRAFPQIVFHAAADPMPVDPAAFDRVFSIASLGRLFRNRREDFPGAPYLLTDPALVEAWRERLGPRTRRLRIGVAWRGGSSRTGQSLRSMTLQDLSPLLTRDDCQVVSLQHGPPDEALAAWNDAHPDAPIAAFPWSDTYDMDQLAALVSALDLVVSVQTTVVHLSGALGAPCLAMLPAQAEWRYGAAGETMPWYGSVKLLRQGRPGDWAPVVEAAMQEVSRR